VTKKVTQSLHGYHNGGAGSPILQRNEKIKVYRDPEFSG
jgi:hypothetical protein